MIYIFLALASGLAWWLISLMIPMPIALIAIPLLLCLLAFTSSAVEPKQEKTIQGNFKRESRDEERDRPWFI